MKEHQHFIPRTYLKNFANANDNKSITGYNKKSEKFVSLSITNVCVEKNFYTLKNLDGKDRLAIEDFFSNEIESKYPKVYRILIIEKKKHVTPEEKIDILSVTLSMYFRTPKQLNKIVSLLDQVIKGIREGNVTKTIDFFGLKIDLKDLNIKDVKKEVKERLRVDYLQIQLQLFQKFVNFKFNNGLTVLSNETDFDFFTGDNPVNFLNLNGLSKKLFDYNNSTYIPLDPKHCLFIAPNKLKSGELSIFHQKDSFQLVHVINSCTQENAELWVLGRNEDLIKAVQKVIELNSTYVEEHPILDEFKFKVELLQSLLKEIKKGVNNENLDLIKKLKEINSWDKVENHKELVDLMNHLKRAGLKF